MASTHNYRSLFNMDISGGMPAVIIQMLVASEPGSIRLLPAGPTVWPSGAIEGVLCRGQVEIKRLSWDKSTISVRLLSARKQQLTLRAPGPIEIASVKSGVGTIRSGEREDTRTILLPAAQEVTIELKLK